MVEVKLLPRVGYCKVSLAVSKWEMANLILMVICKACLMFGGSNAKYMFPGVY